MKRECVFLCVEEVKKKDSQQSRVQNGRCHLTLLLPPRKLIHGLGMLLSGKATA